MNHPCQGCTYAYFADCKKPYRFYNALSDHMDSIDMDVNMPCCGANPGGAVLDNDQPHCAAYTKGEEDEITN